MLILKNIIKEYNVADTKVAALKGINIAFRKNEFVSILGPSGCGKTTTLNIIGGLDKYTSGDLIISNRSTKEFTDRDWDIYRNHRIGFIFQSYNLIPHQTILGNVELALTISGLSKKERVEKAKKALDRVGLKGQYNKKPNQLSGGQCQRVAIARALVNEPEILLADEPTGALDTVTSIQIMDLIQEISKEKLVIMVTHNPDLANKYSTRIIQLLDGKVIEDSNPYSEEEEKKEYQNQTIKEEDIKKEKAKMSLWTAFKLSAQNLFSKRKRTAMVSIAGSIGIIGVSLVLSISGGVKSYISSMQNDMLSGNPIQIAETSYDLSTLVSASNQKQIIDKLEVVDGKVNVNSLIDYLMEMAKLQDNFLISNQINENYIQFIKDMPEEYYAALSFDYGLDLSNNIYTTFTSEDGSVEHLSLSAILETYVALLGNTSFSSLSSSVSAYAPSFEQAPADDEYIMSQYDILEGNLATNKDEVMLVVSKDTELADLLLGGLGYYTQNEFLNIAYKAIEDPHYDSSLNKRQFTYSELLNKEFKLYPNDTIFTKNNNSSTQKVNPFYYSPYSDGFSSSEGLNLKVTGILRPKDNISYGCLTYGIYYNSKLTDYVRENAIKSEICNYLIQNNSEEFISTNTSGVDYGIKYNLHYTLYGKEKTHTAFVGSSNLLSSMMNPSSNIIMKTLSLRDLGGKNIPFSISIYPIDFKLKDNVTNYLNNWNKDGDITLSTGITLTKNDRTDITYTDTIGIIIDLINNMINIISYALISFTALALVVSTVMIGIITYVSVVERIKEIGVIRSLGGRKKDISALFVAETAIIGFTSGAFGVALTYLISLILNICLKPTIGFNIAALPPLQALLMIILSIVLTLISGVLPAKSAARKDPVVALRTE